MLKKINTRVTKKSKLVFLFISLLTIVIMDMFIYTKYFKTSSIMLLSVYSQNATVEVTKNGITSVSEPYLKFICNVSAKSVVELPQSTSSAGIQLNTSATHVPKQTRSTQQAAGKFQENTGYVLATHYVDQLSGATVNVFSLQCWASTLPGRIVVVEPFLHYGSMLGVNLNLKASDKRSSEQENSIKLFDMYDREKWHLEAHYRAFRPIVSWNYLLQYSPRWLILVDKICSDNCQCMACNETNFFESPLFSESAQQFASFYNYSIVRKVCYENRPYSKEEFYYTIYGNFTPSKVVVLFNHFGGFEPDGNVLRFQVDLNNCYRPSLFGVAFPLHQSIYQQSRRYVNAYMPNATNNGYISVMLRTEQFARGKRLESMSPENQMSQLKSCIDDIVRRVKELTSTLNVSDIFLTTDTGKYGSAYFRNMKASHYFHEGVLKMDFLDKKLRDDAGTYFFQKGVLETGLNTLHHSLFGKVVNLEERVDSITSYRVPGYVALLEMALAANGTCLVLAGGGYFQVSVATWHNSLFFTGCEIDYLC